jgi:choline dehydrogenase-like flavoprotein
MGDHYDAIVIGTGFGGAVTACRLAQAGIHTLVLERGRRYDLASLPDLPKPGQIFPDPRRWTWSGSHGLWDVRDLDGVAVAQSAAYGGGSLVYANVHLRPPREVFDEEWPHDCRSRKAIDKYYDLVGYMLDITPVPEAWRKVGKVKVMADAFRDTAGGVGDGNVFFPPLAITFPKETPVEDQSNPPIPPPERNLPLNRYRRHHGECQRCGACDTGCRYGAKNTLDRNYLAVAEDCEANNGDKVATIRTLCEALIVSSCGEGGYEVVYHDHLLGTRKTVAARHVFLCGGSVNTTELLLRSFHQNKQRAAGCGDSTPCNGLTPVQHVGEHYFINSDSLALVANAKRETFPSAGPVITTALVYDGEPVNDEAGQLRFIQKAPRPRRAVPGGGRSWFLIEDGGYPVPVDSLTAVFKTPLLLGRNSFDAEPFRPLTTIHDPLAATASDRYVSLLDGLHAAFREGQLPDVLSKDLKRALDVEQRLARQHRDQEIGHLVEDVRDAVLANLPWLRFVKRVMDRLWPGAWAGFFNWWLRLVGIEREQLLATVVSATEHRYGVDTARTLPERLADALLGRPYPVNRPKTSLRDPPPAACGTAAQAVLLAMGRDDVPACLSLGGDDRLRAQFPNGGFPTLGEEERVMRGIADHLGGTLRTSPLWSLARRPITAHSHGGCALGDVTDDWGEVRGHPNLFINDGSLLPRPVGVNPSSTIAAIAERNIEYFVRRVKGQLPEKWELDIANAKAWREEQVNVSLEPPYPVAPITLHHDPVGFAFVEEMRGRMIRVDEEDSRLPRPGRGRIPLAPFLCAEGRGQDGAPRIVRFRLDAHVRDVGAFLDDPHHSLPLSGKLCLPGDLVEQMPADGVTVDIHCGVLALLVAVANDRRLMMYYLPFDIGGQAWTMIGQKEIQQDPGFDAWLDASTLYVELCRGTVNLGDCLDSDSNNAPTRVVGRGILRLGMHDFAVNQLQGLRALGTTDPARTIWTLGSFGVFFFGQMQGAYSPEIEHFLNLFGRAFWRTAGEVHDADRGAIHALRGL